MNSSGRKQTSDEVRDSGSYRGWSGCTRQLNSGGIRAPALPDSTATLISNQCSQASIDCWAKIPAIAPCDVAWVTEGKKGVVRSPAA